jgi:alanine racemase
VLEVHLDRVARNWLFFKKKLKSGADCAAVVKADAYGLGAAEVSRALFDQGCRHFFVAQAGEAALLRKALPEKDAVIYVLGGPWGMKPSDFTRLGCLPVLNSPQDIETWAHAAAKAGKKLPAVLHLDTGMNRLGLSKVETSALAEDRAALQGIQLRYIMSHLACADEPAHAMNARQLKDFNARIAALGLPCRYSLANSAGILLGPAYHFDLVRPGCGLYGINPSEVQPNPMLGTVTLKARILQTRNIDISSTVGYGASYKARKPLKSVTISAGYADGYLRSATGSGQVFIGGEKCPVIGRVSMDTIIADTTHLKRQPEAGDWAEIIGPHQTADEVAAQAKTIGYEVLTSLGKRYKREYTGYSA